MITLFQSDNAIPTNRRVFKLATTVLCGTSILALVTNCHGRPPDQALSSDLLNLSPPLETQEFRLSLYPGKSPVEIVVANSTDATGGHDEGGNYAEIARTDLNEIFANCENYVVANRSVNRQASAERKLGQTTAAPVAPKFIIKATVLEVQREIKSDGTATSWEYMISAESAKARRQGAVEVLVEVVGVDTLTTLFATRAYALLYDESKESSLGLLVLSHATKSTKHVPERQAIRTACEQAAVKVHTYFQARQ
jgi:hypothetical protein